MDAQPELVQPDPKNQHELALASAFNAVCSGQVIFMNGATALQTAENQLRAGSLLKMRREFVDSIIQIGIPILEGNPVRLGANLSFARERLEAPREFAMLIRRSWDAAQRTEKNEK